MHGQRVVDDQDYIGGVKRIPKNAGWHGHRHGRHGRKGNNGGDQSRRGLGTK